MRRGKETCRILKEIRRQIADANDIEYITSECRFQGDCLGTCPKCEAEVQYLEQQLSARHAAGKAIALAGISAGLLFSLATSCASNSQPILEKEQSTESTNKNKDVVGIVPNTSQQITCEIEIDRIWTKADADSVAIYGIVKDSITNKSIKNATISEVDNMSNSTESDINGIFSIKVKKGSKVIIIAPFYKDLSFIADSNCNIKAYLKEEPELDGEIPAPVENTP